MKKAAFLYSEHCLIISVRGQNTQAQRKVMKINMNEGKKTDFRV